MKENTKGIPDLAEQLRVLRLSESREYVYKFNKRLAPIFLTMGPRWVILVKAFATEALHSRSDLQRVCQGMLHASRDLSLSLCAPMHVLQFRLAAKLEETTPRQKSRSVCTVSEYGP